MELGVAFPASTTVSSHVALAESLGYSHAWLDDSQLLFSDPYVSLALCAERTQTISLGVGVTNPSTRTAAVTANAIATVNRLAPGRVVLGIGTGNTALRTMGLPAARVAALREHVEAVRALLAGETARQVVNGSAREFRFLNPDGDWIDISTRIPIFVAGSGPKVLALAGECGDGVIIFGAVDPELVKVTVARIREGARTAGRGDEEIPVMCMTAFCLLDEDEQLPNPRVLPMIGPFVSSAANILALSNPDRSELPSHLRSDILAFGDAFNAPAAEDDSSYEGYATGVRPELAERMTDALIRATTLTGTAAEIRQRLEDLENAGVNMVAIRPVVDIDATITSFAEVAAV